MKPVAFVPRLFVSGYIHDDFNCAAVVVVPRRNLVAYYDITCGYYLRCVSAAFVPVQSVNDALF